MWEIKAFIKSNNKYEFNLELVQNNSALRGECGVGFHIKYCARAKDAEDRGVGWIRTEQIPALIKALTDIWFDAEHQTVDNSQEPTPQVKSQED